MVTGLHECAILVYSFFFQDEKIVRVSKLSKQVGYSYLMNQTFMVLGLYSKVLQINLIVSKCETNARIIDTYFCSQNVCKE